MKDSTTIFKLVFPTIITIAGLIAVYMAIANDQNWQFKLAAFAVLLTGVLYFFNTLKAVSKNIQIGLTAVLVTLAFVLAALDYRSIKDPIDFMDERKKRDEHIVQRLKDIRSCELAYKAVKGAYTNNFDTLLYFVKNDSFPVIKAIGDRPDTLSEEQAIEMGIIHRDTFMVSVSDSIFSDYQLSKRTVPFYFDSIPYIPWGGAEKITLNAGEIERNNTKVKVFEAFMPYSVVFSDWNSHYYNKLNDQKVGSMSEPSTSGNWGE
ncbi:MAG: hypothetical protein COA57_14915 [Flavobacteriales bacterium]|nr:MAG: hypothetical protein COA57_14915 [Flavobacteriales bacterium]